MKSASRYLLGDAVIVSTTAFSQGLAGQETRLVKVTAVEYGNTQWFPRFWEPYATPRVPEQKMSNSERLHSLIYDGRPRLCIEDAIALALENNMDIVIARAPPALAWSNSIEPLECTKPTFYAVGGTLTVRIL